MKRREEGRWDQAWGGIASLGLALQVLWTGMSRRGLGLECLAKWMGAGPARLAGLSGRKGFRCGRRCGFCSVRSGRAVDCFA